MFLDCVFHECESQARAGSSLVQAFLRELPLNAKSTETWKLLFRMSFAYNWTPEPRFPEPQDVSNA